MKKSVAMFVVTSLLGTGAFLAHAETYPADNSGQNAGDASGASVTAGDQSSTEADVAITTSIRQAVTADDALSINAKNVKIITIGGIVTLRGPVASDAERASIKAKAKGVAGVTRVVDQLEIAGN